MHSINGKAEAISYITRDDAMKCPRCGDKMEAYVSSSRPESNTERRLYFVCRCGAIAARNESELEAPQE